MKIFRKEKSIKNMEDSYENYSAASNMVVLNGFINRSSMRMRALPL